ncbi:uncharacterized protein LOC108669201 isoform X2 [Hyalella azteca]|uniref:Uncharacterized protein LOC108669201 isoform X2 n=1 Tax=Hyalella azteca TaxID=294128 RepID=A0A8B7NEF7_HYAAZ|nr:uncharacterized protein LOC108669201 isoform X2 [Hyalella azteca]
MSWPSFYGYKYTPIGLRQRDIIEESGKRTVSTTVHLPEGGHLLDIERKYSPDGSIAKKETSCFVPSAISAPSPRPAPSGIGPVAPSSPFYEDFEPRGLGDLERQADDIIANFRARNQTGLDEMRQRAKRVMGEDF